MLLSHPRWGVESLNSTLLLARNSSPRPVYSSLIPGAPNPKVSLECPTLECSWSSTPESPWSAHPDPECLRSVSWSAQPQSLPGVPNAQPQSRAQSLPGVPNPRTGVPNPRVSLPREGGDVRSKIICSVFTLYLYASKLPDAPNQPPQLAQPCDPSPKGLRGINTQASGFRVQGLGFGLWG